MTTKINPLTLSRLTPDERINKKSKVEVSADDISTGTGDVSQVIEAAREMMQVAMKIEKCEETLALLKADYLLKSTETLPRIMEAAGYKVGQSLDLPNGYRIELNPAFRANIPAEGTIEKAEGEEKEALLVRREEGIAWLDANGGEPLIKQRFQIDLPKDFAALRPALRAAVAKLVASAKFKKARIELEEKETIHAGSLAKFLREKIAAGKDVPLETFAVFNGKCAEIKAPSQGKKDKKTNG